MTEVLQATGVIASTLCVTAALLARERRVRSAALGVGLLIAFVLLAGEGWKELESLRERPVALAAAMIAASAGLAGLVVLFLRRPWALPVLLVFALPFRIPIDVGAEDVNLLIPLYAVIAGGVIASLVSGLREGGDREGSEPRPLLIVIAGALLLYALQSVYSSDLSFATRNVGFFLVPFAVMFALLVEMRWTPRLLGICLAVVAGEALVFAAVGFYQHVTGEIFWNEALEMSNDFHFYFRVNSLFFDPNIYGRYLALAAVLVLAVLVWSRDPRRMAVLAGVLAALLIGLTLALSQTSFVALLCGVAVLCALRWSLRWTLIAAPFAAVLIVAAVIVVGGTSEAEDSAAEVTSGRSTLVEGGVDLAAERPLWGHGSGSFSEEFNEREDIDPDRTTVSHNEPVTVAAEQGVMGLIAYAALVLVALWVLFAGMRSVAPGLGASPDAIGDSGDGGPGALALARIAVAAGFCALLVHTIGYAGYLTDPLTWALLAIGASLAPDISLPRGSVPGARRWVSEWR